MNPFETKAIFSWQIPNITKDPFVFAKLLSDAGFEAVYLKVADGSGTFGDQALLASTIQALRARKIIVIGWGFNYGLDWKGEARIAASQVNRYGLDGYIWDVESRYETTPNAVQNSYNMLAVFKQEIAKPTPSAFCSWAFWKSQIMGSEIHPIKVLQGFMDGCDYGMPMQYWQGKTPDRAVSYLKASVEQWRKYTTKPIIPAGRAYNGDGGESNPESMIAYEQSVREIGCKGISWWELDQAQPKYHQDWWDGLSMMRKFGSEIVVTPPEGPSPDVRTITITKTIQIDVTTSDPANTGVTVKMS